VCRHEGNPKIPRGDCVPETAASAGTYQVSACCTARGLKSEHLQCRSAPHQTRCTHPYHARTCQIIFVCRFLMHSHHPSLLQCVTTGLKCTVSQMLLNTDSDQIFCNSRAFVFSSFFITFLPGVEKLSVTVTILAHAVTSVCLRVYEGQS